MIYLNINAVNHDNDVRVMIQAFYPGEKIIIDETMIRECIGTVRVNIEDNLISACLDFGKKVDFKCTCEDSDRKTIRDNLKRELYRAFNKITGKVLPWGTLTGIRPTKILYNFMEEGMDEASIKEQIAKEYLASPAKIDLACEVAQNERRLLHSVDFEKGYSLYVGIPFCPTTCLYCSFTSYPLSLWKNRVDEYLDALIKELSFYSEMLKGKKATSIYMGGGTPTTLNAGQLTRLITFIRENFDISELKEFTVEAGRPDSIDESKLEALRALDIDRISINPQTMNQKTLDLIGRRHSVTQVKDAFYLARECGFTNINMDLIIGLPGETKEDVAHTLDELRIMRPDSLTVHSLAIKRAARLNIFKDDYKDYRIENTDEIISMTYDFAKELGLEPYYLYRQKNMAGNFENVGYAKKDCFGLYNVLIMEEVQTIVAAGAGTVCKRVYPGGRIERCDNVKDVGLYISKIDEMIERKRELFGD